MRFLVAASLLCVVLTPCRAEDASPAPDGDALRLRNRLAKEAGSPEFQNVRKAIEALTPEQRLRFEENFRRWVNLPPEQKKVLREREEVRRKLMKEELDAALAESGLQLEGEQREQFIKRYGEERRKIEEQLRREMHEKRKPLLKDVLARLREEFSTVSSPTATPAPVP